VGELREALDASQQNVSKHLGVLHTAGIVSRTKEGTAVRYAIADPSVFRLCEEVCGGLRAQLSEFQQILDAA
jgi:DNA-binding transcriptional ArsR family regulator